MYEQIAGAGALQPSVPPEVKATKENLVVALEMVSEEANRQAKNLQELLEFVEINDDLPQAIIDQLFQPYQWVLREKVMRGELKLPE